MIRKQIKQTHTPTEDIRHKGCLGKAQQEDLTVEEYVQA